MRRISCGVTFPALAIAGLCQTSCASSQWVATKVVDDSSYLASTASLQSNGLVFEEAIRKCRDAVLKAAKPYGVVHQTGGDLTHRPLCTPARNQDVRRDQDVRYRPTYGKPISATPIRIMR
jgi:hypothetical protein